MNSKTRWMASFLAVSFIGLQVTSTAAAGKEVKVGDLVGKLTFKDIHYLPRSLDDFKDKKAFVLVFTNTTCPVARRYLPVLQQMEKDYRGKGVQFLAVNVGADDTIVAMAAQAVEHEMEFPFVKDQDFACFDALGVKRTPEAVILDGKGRLSYRGRIDDQYRLGGTRESATRHDLKEALDALLAGREIDVKETPVDGCLVTKPATRPAGGQFTYAEHVAPLLQKHCQECHRPGTSAPFSLVTYKQAAAKADTIAEVVAEQRMPPWFASPDHGKFANRRGLSAEERDLLIEWARSGKALGDETKIPKVALPDPEAGKWLIGKPDLIIPAAQHDLPASGDIPYKYTILPYVFQHDTWLQGVQILPDNPRVLHHCNMAFGKVGGGFSATNFVTGTVPGGEPMRLFDGTGFCIPKGSSLALQIHYVSTGKPEKCRISVGLKYANGTVQRRLHHMLLVDHKFAIPPGAPAHPVGNSKVLTTDAVGIGLFVHMHVRGKDMTFRAHYPDGTSETLLVVPNYNFDWQMPYRFEQGKKKFPKGTRLEALAHYDNSTFNPYNPNPKVTVRDGPQTYQEMMNGFVFYTDEKERLNLEIDPKTGRVRGEQAKAN